MADIFDELDDKKLLKTIAEGRRAIRAGSKGVLFSRSLKKRNRHCEAAKRPKQSK